MKKYVVIGDPIAHSMSPVMHNDLFHFYQIEAQYDLFHIKKGMLKEGLSQLKEMGIAGFNITVPHKSDIIPFLDELDPLSQAIGAVNTVVNENGKWVGYNTDGYGYVRGLLTLLPVLTDKKVMMIGAGGAARAIYFTLAHEKVQKIDIVNRTLEKAENLKKACPYSVETEVLNLQSAKEKCGEYDLIIQTTSIGMSPYIKEQPISLENLNSNSLVSDIIYNPLETKLLYDAKMKGAIVQNGLEMFVFQGALAFEKWTGIFPDTERMKRNVLKQLGGNFDA
ncbi:shikimate dehydrogenase [Niallia sp. NCCP-28]|uniref:shikimate dehydrogenase n=1 Tax=Niallia sp. NCCP-28 TaxID=2934712 RepID=UPI00208D995D|nr:shikimate dehydrogenase [Niallia sp. NCCP-28]GKU81344.1 shikimate dehydrogenase (NADP(+)) [Niallia sp. NCCP-28]